MDKSPEQQAVKDFNSLWDYAKPEETRQRFIDWLEQTDDGLDLDTRLQVRTQIARTHSLAAEFEQAHNVLDTVQNELSANTPLARIRYHLERGRTFNSADNKAQAREHFIQAYELADQAGNDNYRIDAAHMMAIAESDLDSRLAWNDKGLKAARMSDDPAARKWIGVFHNNSGWDLFEAERYDEALQQFELCRDFHQQQGNGSNLDIARWSIAKTYRYLGRVDEALAIQQDLLKQGGGKDDSGYTYEELAELNLIKGNQDQARDYFNRAYQILSQDTWLQRNEAERLVRLRQLSE